MKVHIIGNNHSIFNHFVAELRDVTIQQDRMRFRRNLERMGEILSYEISKTFQYSTRSVQTPLGIAQENLIDDQIVVGSILRAGLTMHNGLLNYFDNAENAFISAYRAHKEDGSFDIKVEYFASPHLEGKILILADPMLATGRSMVMCHEAMLAHGVPKHTHVVAAIGSKEGVEYVKREMPENTTIWVGTVDDELSADAYIIPGLGDAGDLSYGGKL